MIYCIKDMLFIRSYYLNVYLIEFLMTTGFHEYFWNANEYEQMNIFENNYRFPC